MTRNLIVGLLACLLVACAAEAPKTQSSPSATNVPAATPAAPAAAPAAPTAAAPDAGKAMVIFYRPSRFVGGAVGFIVREGTTELGKLRSGKYFTVQVTPGKHTYVVHSEAKDELTIDADAGETYYVEGEIGVGVLVGHPHIKPSDKSSFEAVKDKLQQVPTISS
jgi:hypothetical protein